MDDFAYSFIVSALVVALAMLMGAGGGFSLPAALGLLALSQVGFFTLRALSKAGVKSPSSEYVFVMMVFLCYSAACLAFGAFAVFFPFLFVPVIFCAPAAGSLARGYFAS